MSDGDSYIFPDITCPKCGSKRGIQLSNDDVRCSDCNISIQKARRF